MTSIQNDIKTALKDVERDLKENENKHASYKARHDKLELVEIEYVRPDPFIISDENFSDEEEEDAVTEAKMEVDADEGDQAKMDVDPPPRADPYQFYWYTPEELESFSQRQLVADVALYEGLRFLLPDQVVLLIASIRAR